MIGRILPEAIARISSHGTVCRTLPVGAVVHYFLFSEVFGLLVYYSKKERVRWFMKLGGFRLLSFMEAGLLVVFKEGQIRQYVFVEQTILSSVFLFCYQFLLKSTERRLQKKVAKEK
jgi:hypothetical protein